MPVQALSGLAALAAVAANAHRWGAHLDEPVVVGVSAAFVAASLIVLSLAIRGPA